MSSVEHLADCIEQDLRVYLPKAYKNPLRKLSVMVGCMIETKSCNTMALAARLPMESGRFESRYRWVERFLSTETIEDMRVMESLSIALLETVSRNGQMVVASLDQTSIGDDRAIAMLSIRVGERAVPLFWSVALTKGNMPVSAYLPLLGRLKNVLPENAEAMILGDRFFGASELVAACQKHGFHYRLRLKGNLTLTHQGGELRVDDMAKLTPGGLTEAELWGTGVITNIGYIHEKGHPEPWFIAMNAIASKTTVLDYGLRWSIETLFSDYKTRGFGLEDTHLQRPDRISRLLLVMAIALYWATINGHHAQKNTGIQAA